MSGKWVDHTSYFGPNRRRPRSGVRLLDRRRVDEAGDLPRLPALLRRIRVALLALHTSDDRAYTLDLAAAAINRAEDEGRWPCADAIRAAMRIINGGDRAEFAEADALLIRALDEAS